MPPRRQMQPAVPAREKIEELQDEKALATVEAASEFLGKFAGIADVKAIVMRRSAETGKWEYVKTFAPDIVDEDYLRSHFGAGSYKLIVRGPKSEGHEQGYYGSLVMDIANLGGDAPAAAAAPGESGTEKMLTILLQRSDQQNAQTMALLLEAIRAIGNRSSESITDPLKVVELAQKIAGFGSGAIAPDQYIKDRAESFDKGFEKGVDIGTREGRRGDAEVGWPSVIREMAIPALEAIKGATPALAPAPPQPARLAPVPMPPAPVPPIVQEVHNVNEPVWYSGLKKWLPVIGFAAQNGMAPGRSASLVMDQIADEQYDAFVDDVVGPDFAARMTPLLPAALVQRYPEWVSQTLAAIRAAVEEEQADAGPVGLGDEPVGDEPPEGAEP